MHNTSAEGGAKSTVRPGTPRPEGKVTMPQGAENQQSSSMPRAEGEAASPNATATQQQGKGALPSSATQWSEAQQRKGTGNKFVADRGAAATEETSTRAGRRETNAQTRQGDSQAGQQGDRRGQQAKKQASSAFRTATGETPSPVVSREAAGTGRSLTPPLREFSLDNEFSLEEGNDAWKSALSEATKTASGKNTQTQNSSAARRAMPTAWLKAAAQGPLRTTELAGGWKAVELSLGEGDGTVTIKARRDQDGVAVSVGFSESRLQTQATANARQIQDALQAEYETDVDLSFAEGDAGSADQQAADGDSSRERASVPSSQAEIPAEENTSAATATTRHGARREWVG